MMDDPSHLGLNYNRVDMEVRVKPFSNKQTVKVDDSLEDSAEYELLCRLIYAVLYVLYMYIQYTNYISLMYQSVSM